MQIAHSTPRLLVSFRRSFELGRQPCLVLSCLLLSCLAVPCPAPYLTAVLVPLLSTFLLLLLLSHPYISLTIPLPTPPNHTLSHPLCVSFPPCPALPCLALPSPVPLPPSYTVPQANLTTPYPPRSCCVCSPTDSGGGMKCCSLY